MLNDSLRVLIADDSPPMRKMIVALLKGFDVEIVAEVENGVDAVQAFEKFNPDITFLDIKMPVKDGLEALGEIIKHSPSAAVVMLTAVSDMAIADECVEAGARGYIRKGAAPAALHLLLKAQIEEVRDGAEQHPAN